MKRFKSPAFPFLVISLFSQYDIIFTCHHFVKSIQIGVFFWSVFSFIRTKKNSVFEHFSCSVQDIN